MEAKAHAAGNRFNLSLPAKHLPLMTYPTILSHPINTVECRMSLSIWNINVNTRWKVDHGKAWEHLGGEVFGQTQIAYSRNGIISDDSTAYMVFNHPLDLHFAAAGLQVTISKYWIAILISKISAPTENSDDKFIHDFTVFRGGVRLG